MRTFEHSRWPAYAMLGWLAFFVVSHAIVAAFPGDDPGGDGPWGRTAFVVYNVILIGIAAVGAVLLVPTTLRYLHRSRSEPHRRPAVDTAGVVGPAR